MNNYTDLQINLNEGIEKGVIVRPIQATGKTLKVVASELVNVYENEEGKKIVDARELHEWLQSGQDFSDWVKNRIAKYEFIEDLDFTIILGKSTGGRPSREYAITLEMAKELSMVENNEKGRQARKYFIKCENKLKEIAQYPKLSKELQAIFAIDAKQQELEFSVTEVKERVEIIENKMVIDYSQQEEIRTKVNAKVIQELGGMDSPAYKKLNKKAFASFWRDYKRQLNVNSYKNTATVKFGKALEFINNWKPNMDVDLMIKGANSQKTL